MLKEYLQEMLLLRPHHINCIFFYRGLGYSKEFVEGMNNTLSILTDNPNTKIKLVVNCDVLCNNCPSKQSNNTCLTKEKVDNLDLNTLQVYNLKENQEYEFIEIINNIYKNFDKTNFHKICSSCNWYKEGTCCDSIITEQIKDWNFCK